MLLAAMAMLWDVLTGEPKRLYNKIQHPVSWMASLLMFLEKRFNNSHSSGTKRKTLGLFALLLCVAVCGSIALLIEGAIALLFQEDLILQTAVIALFASVFVAARSLHEHVTAVKTAHVKGELPASRAAVGLIVGRDTTTLDETGIARAATESLAENFSDGVVAPVFWLAVAGLPGIVIYKMVSTADSMIGHKTDRFQEYGWASARLDDVLNFIPARVTALLVILSGFFLHMKTTSKAIRVTLRDSRLHASPNAGWPEAAMAGVLGVRLGGPRQYSSVVQRDYAWLGAEFPANKQPDLAMALKLIKVSWLIVLAALAAGGLL